MGKQSRKQKRKGLRALSPQSEAGGKVRGDGGPRLAAGLVVALVCIGVYANTLHNGFVYDDAEQVLNNKWITDVRFIPDMFTNNAWAFKHDSVGNYYRPMMHLTYLVLYHVLGPTPWVFHLANIILHIGVSVLVFAVALTFFGREEPARSPPAPASRLHAIVPAFATALIFATHPIHTEAVAWIAGVPDLAYAFFFLFSFWLYLRFQDGVRWAYPLSLASFAIAALCKEPALMLPLVLAAHDAIFRRGPDRLGVRIRAYAPYLVVAAAYMSVRRHALGGFSPQQPHTALTFWGYAMNSLPLFAEYFLKLIAPTHLSAFHVLHPIASLFEARGVAALAFAGAFLAFLFMRAGKDQLLCFGLAVTALPLLPVLYIPALGENVFAERYLYLPSMGFALLVGLAVSWVAKRIGWVQASGMVMGLAAGYALLAISRNEVWRDNITLFEDTVRKSPDAAMIHNNLGVLYDVQGRAADATKEYQAAVLLKPDYVDARNNLGSAYQRAGRIDDAIREVEAALKTNADFAVGHFNLGALYDAQGRRDDAIREYARAVVLKPDDTDAHSNLGADYLQRGNLEEAAKELKAALALRPGLESATKDLKACEERMRDGK